MKRRKFLGASIAGLSIPVVAASSTRLYGTPASVTGPVAVDRDMLVLSLSRMNLGLSSNVISTMASTGQIWADVFSDSNCRNEFASDPVKFMTSRGIPDKVAEASKNDITVLKACCDSRVLDAASKGDAVKFLGLLKEKGLHKSFSSEISGRVRELISKDQAAFKESFSKVAENYKNKNISEIENDLFIASIIGDTTMSDALVKEYNELLVIVGAVVAVAILATVVLYISVAVFFTVETVAAIHSVAAVKVGATVSSQEKQPGGAGIESHAARMQAYSETYESFRNVSKVALITGVPNASIEVIKEFISVEIESILTVAVDLGLMELSDELKPIIVKHAAKSTYLAMGIPA